MTLRCEICLLPIGNPSGCNVFYAEKTYWVHSGECRAEINRRHGLGFFERMRAAKEEKKQDERNAWPDPLATTNGRGRT